MHGTWQRRYGYSRWLTAPCFQPLHVQSMDGGSEGLGGRRAADGEGLEKAY